MYVLVHKPGPAVCFLNLKLVFVLKQQLFAHSGAANLAERDEALVGRTIKVLKGPFK